MNHSCDFENAHWVVCARCIDKLSKKYLKLARIAHVSVESMLQSGGDNRSLALMTYKFTCKYPGNLAGEA